MNQAAAAPMQQHAGSRARILHVGKYFPPDYGGMEIFLADLIAAQQASGQAAFAIVHGTPRAEDPDWLVRVPIYGKLLYIPVAPSFGAALDAAIERYQPDYLHLHMPNLSAFWALASSLARSIPWVIHWHSDVVTSKTQWALNGCYHAYRPFEQALLARAESIYVTSPNYLAASSALARWHAKCRVIPLGIDFSRLQSEVPFTGWREGAFRLLSVGRLTYYKGFETLIRAVADLPDVELRIVGDGVLRARLSRLIQELAGNKPQSNIILMGACSDLVRNGLIASCDVFCLASRERTEAFGIAIMEAAYFARPCFVTDLAGSGLPWLVRKLENGLTLPVDEPKAWQQAIEQAQKAPELLAQYGLRGQENLSQFSINQTALLLEQTLPMSKIASEDACQSVLIVIPARNEATSIAQVIADIRQHFKADVLVIDDQSMDGTAELAQQAGATVLRPVLPLGAWGAMQAGMRYAVKHGYNYAVTMDADGQHEAVHLADLLKPLIKNEADVVIGAFPARGSNARRMAWAVFRVMTGLGFEDLTSGFRAYNQPALKRLSSPGASLLDYQDIGVLLYLRRRGFRIVEIPVKMQLRSDGGSRIFSSWFAVASYLLKTAIICIADHTAFYKKFVR